jgi:hypothetical protein
LLTATAAIVLLTRCSLWSQAAKQTPVVGKSLRYCNPLPLEASSKDGSPQGVSLGDVTVVRDGNLYYMFGTGGGGGFGQAGPGGANAAANLGTTGQGTGAQGGVVAQNAAGAAGGGAPGVGGLGGGGFGAPDEWKATLELLIATSGGDAYKKRLAEMFPQQRFGASGWMAVRALPYMDAAFKKQFEDAVKVYVPQLDTDLAQTPFGVPPSLGTWGAAPSVADMGTRMYFLHKAFPELVGTEYTLRAVNYLLGTHPVSSTSYISSIGTVSKLKAYGNNRADNTFIPGGLIPGYIIIKPDFPEAIDDFGFLWFENEYTIGVASKWILAANAANALAK